MRIQKEEAQSLRTVSFEHSQNRDGRPCMLVRNIGRRTSTGMRRIKCLCYLERPTNAAPVSVMAIATQRSRIFFLPLISLKKKTDHNVATHPGTIELIGNVTA